jgi:hypothetical protein
MLRRTQAQLPSVLHPVDEVVPAAKAVPIELLLTYYSSARSELLQRIVQRDASLALFIGGTAAIYGVAIHDLQRSYALLYLIPLLGLGASCIHSQHTRVIGAIGNYLTNEFEDSLKTVTGASQLPIQWDNSLSLLELRGTVAYRFLANIVLLILPQIIALGVADYETRSIPLIFLGTSVGALFCGVSLTMEILNFKRRSEGHRARRIKLSGSSTVSSPGIPT